MFNNSKTPSFSLIPELHQGSIRIDDTHGVQNKRSAIASIEA